MARQSSHFVLPSGVNPIMGSILNGRGDVLEVPDIIEFVVSDRYLNRPQLYPRQATILKAIFLQDNIFTNYDYQVIEEWSEGFALDMAEGSEGAWRYRGNHGFQPDLLERIYINQQDGRKWFRECVVAIGRRGGKGYLGAICGAYVLWNFLAKSNPQDYYGVDRDKRLSALIFAGKLNQAKAEQFRDVVNVITGSNCFAPFISQPMAESLTIYAPNDVYRAKELERRGIKSDVDIATFQIMPKEATVMSGRGPASFMQFYDEMAHVNASTSRASASEVYSTATPSLDQFKQDAFIWEGSSTWQMMGQFYTNWQQALEVDSVTKKPIYPEKFMVQLESWDPYLDWQEAPKLKLRRGFKRHFIALKDAPQEYDDNMRKLERANPETFLVERRSHWASSQSAYLNPVRVRQMFESYNGRTLEMQKQGMLHIEYAAHVDPSKSGANTGLAIAHVEGPDENGYHHVVFDLLKHWRPGDFPDNDNEIDYLFLEQWLNENVTDLFMPANFTFDQFDHSIIQRVRNYAQIKQRPKSVRVYERTATKSVNWQMAEGFKTALGLGLLHAPYYEQAELEMIYLQDIGHERVDCPDDGPVQTKDVWDAMANVTYALIGQEMMAFLGKQFSDVGIRGMVPGGVQPFAQQFAGEDREVQAMFSEFGTASVRQRGEMARRSPARNTQRGDRPSGWSPSSPWNRR